VEPDCVEAEAKGKDGRKPNSTSIQSLFIITVDDFTDAKEHALGSFFILSFKGRIPLF